MPRAGPWYLVENADDIPSPSLLIYRDRVEANIREMVAIAGDADRLRPHVKTHKLAEVTRLQMAAGATRFKCATIAEAEMVAACGARDVLLAYQPVGPNVARLRKLADRFEAAAFSAVVDDEGALERISAGFRDAASPIELLLDLDVGMHRSGIAPGPRAADLYARIASLPGVRQGGVHAYDGHIRDFSVEARAAAADRAFAPVRDLVETLERAGHAVPRVVVGGTPTFPVHARREGVELSPGTCVFWDAGYGASLPDLPFRPAALVLTRVVSRPGGTRLCLDLGHKAIASESPHPRVQLLNLPDAAAVLHSEEHLVVETPRASAIAVGDCCYGVPWHICPTVALHAEAVVIEGGRATDRWRVASRDRRLTI
jgi:D-serine deaminase-like pyridoxal phosphate-dependent protein